MKVVNLSALSASRFYPQGDTSGTHFSYGLSQMRGHSAAGGVKVNIRDPANDITSVKTDRHQPSEETRNFVQIMQPENYTNS
jgi:hypothetical protein